MPNRQACSDPREESSRDCEADPAAVVWLGSWQPSWPTDLFVLPFLGFHGAFSNTEYLLNRSHLTTFRALTTATLILAEVPVAASLLLRIFQRCA